MAKKEEDAFEGDIFSGFGTEIEPGHVITDLTGKLRYRQGGDYDDWSMTGGTKYLPRNWYMQCGAAKDIFAAATSGGFEVEYPEPFGNNPIFLCDVIATLPVFTEITCIECETQSPSVMEIYWWSAANITRIYINWLAIGPVGFN
jgi:hypothetical protein